MRFLNRLPLLGFLLLFLVFASTGCAQLDAAYWKIASQQREEALALGRSAFAKAEQAALAASLTPDTARSIALMAARSEITDYVKGRGTDEVVARVTALLPGLVADVSTGNWTGTATGGGAILMSVLLWFWGKGRYKQLATALVAQLDPHTAAIALDDVATAARLPAMAAVRPWPTAAAAVGPMAAPAVAVAAAAPPAGSV